MLINSLSPNGQHPNNVQLVYGNLSMDNKGESSLEKFYSMRLMCKILDFKYEPHTVTLLQLYYNNNH